MSDRLTCDGCQHYSALSRQCRRNPPQPVIIGTDSNGSPAVAGMWPAVNATDWCGEFNRAEVVAVNVAGDTLN